MYAEEKRYAVLAKQLRNYDYVIIDTCSLMDESFPEWMDVFELAKKEYVDENAEDFHAYVPYRCYEELKKHAKIKSNDPELIEKQIAAKRALRIVKWAKFRKILEITKKDKEENYADNAITVKVIHDRLDKRILVITQDKGLASDLLYWNHSQSQRGKYVAVYRLAPNGELAPNRGKTSPAREPQKNYKPAAPERAQTPKQNQKSAPSKQKKADYDAVSNDKRLKALLTNPNYPMDKKKKDVQSHLEGLSSLPEEKRKALPLLLSEGALRQFLLTGTVGEKKDQQVQQQSEPKKAEEPKADEPKEMTIDMLMRKFRYGEALSLKEAFSQCGTFYNIMFRYHSIPYNPQFHGPIDLTEEDLDAMSRMADDALDGNTLIHLEYKKIILYVYPRNLTFRVWMDFSAALPAPVEKPAQQSKKEEAKKPNKAAESTPKAEHKAKQKKPEPQKEAADKPAEKPSAQQNAVKPKAKKKPTKATQKPVAEKTAPAVTEPAKKEEPAQQIKPASVSDKPKNDKKRPNGKNQKKSNKKQESQPVQEPETKEPVAPAKPSLAPEKPKGAHKGSSGKKQATNNNQPEPQPKNEPKAQETNKSSDAPAPKKPAKQKPAKKAQPKVEQQAPKSKPEQASPQPKAKAAKSDKTAKAEPKKEKPKSATKPKQEPAKPAEKAQKQQPKQKPNNQPKKQEKSAEKPSKDKKQLSLFDDAKAADMRLRANVNNSNYPVASKIADLKAQLERLKKLKVEERKELGLSIDTIKMMIRMLESAK